MLKSTAVRASKIIELRTYTIKPDHFPQYMKMTTELFQLRLAHSKLLGFWITEIGGQNEVFHIWEYDSLTHRKQVRDALAGDAEWVEKYLSNARVMFQKQENVLGKFDELCDAPANDKPQFYGLFGGGGIDTAASADVHLAASMQTIFNGTGAEKGANTLKLVYSNDLDALVNIHQKNYGGFAKILYPAPFAKKFNLYWQ